MHQKNVTKSNIINLKLFYHQVYIYHYFDIIFQEKIV